MNCEGQQVNFCKYEMANSTYSTVIDCSNFNGTKENCIYTNIESTYKTDMKCFQQVIGQKWPFNYTNIGIYSNI